MMFTDQKYMKIPQKAKKAENRENGQKHKKCFFQQSPQEMFLFLGKLLIFLCTFSETIESRY